MPERALLRLRRAEIALYDVKKTQKNVILLRVKQKDVEKVFAIYPDVCYNIGAYTPYVVKRMSPTGMEKWLTILKKRWGVLLGIPLFCAASSFADGLVFGIDVVGSDVYKREVFAALDEAGIRPFGKYTSKNEDMICAKLLALKDVEFCSVQKSGLWVRVEMRLGKFPTQQSDSGAMRSLYTGEIVAITALRGTPLKKVGDKIVEGETLVGDSFSIEGGGQVRVEIIARVRIACVYEALVCAESEQAAFAKAYLEIARYSEQQLTQRVVEKSADGENTYVVRLAYVATQTMNLAST